jgi:hypothetical protein
MPIVRAAYETALTAQWAALTKHSTETLLQVHDQSMTTLSGDLRRAESPTLLAAVNDQTYEGVDVERIDSTAYTAARRFQTMCDDLMPRGSDKYVFYRFMSLGVHPGVNVMNQYLISEGPECEPESVKLRAQPLQRGLVEWMGFLAASALWAFAAVDYLERRNPNRELLRDIGARMEVTPMLALTSEARARYFTEARNLHRSTLGGPTSEATEQDSSGRGVVAGAPQSVLFRITLGGRTQVLGRTVPQAELRPAPYDTAAAADSDHRERIPHRHAPRDHP